MKKDMISTMQMLNQVLYLKMSHKNYCHSIDLQYVTMNYVDNIRLLLCHILSIITQNVIQGLFFIRLKNLEKYNLNNIFNKLA